LHYQFAKIWLRGTNALNRNKASAMLFNCFQIEVIAFTKKQPIPAIGDQAQTECWRKACRSRYLQNPSE
jgi:hypothetical protein